ncbi:MAG TPA: hydrogenase maturation nickel metallochaperone HypA [Verrucomicrobiae bacterium]|nr:hydrogenase maturation nickel metallochaperone HypA [Verrucomicrobiae bacterium]
MHELSLMTDAMEQAQALARRNGATRIHRIRMRVGTLSGAVPEALEFAFEALKPGTLAEDGRLEIERIPASFRCGQCGETLALQEVDFTCPKCGGPLTLAGGGRELELADMEIS